MKMKIGRLYKMAKFLETLPEENFDFGITIEYMGDPTKPINKCGTVGCAIGWAPKVFPSLVEWDILQMEVQFIKKGYPDFDFAAIGSELFDINDRESGRLFSSLSAPWNTDKMLSEIWTCRATPKNVATSIRNYIKWKKAGNSL
jgi:hypothetical protein